MTQTETVVEERWVPITESGDRWVGRSKEAAEEALTAYGPGFYSDGEPVDGVVRIVRETRTVTPWKEDPA